MVSVPPLTIANVMLSRNDGGLERMALHQAKGLTVCGHQVTTFLYPESAVRPLAERFGLVVETFSHKSRWNPLVPRLLWRRIKRIGADLVLTHGNRATELASTTTARHRPVIGVAHSTWFKSRPGLAGIVSLTQENLRHWQQQGVTSAFAPNFLADGLPAIPPRPLRQPPVIGALGRFVAKKGFNDLLQAAAILQEAGRDFRLVIGGSGVEGPALQKLTMALGLGKRVHFAGWVPDSAAFLSELDIFVLPSREELFGIVVLEAWRAGLPAIAAATEGPRSFIRPGVDGLLVPVAEPAALAEALATLMDDPVQALRLAGQGQASFSANYAASGGAALSAAIMDILGQAGARP